MAGVKLLALVPFGKVVVMFKPLIVQSLPPALNDTMSQALLFAGSLSLQEPRTSVIAINILNMNVFFMMF
jgi:hypothetical protein